MIPFNSHCSTFNCHLLAVPFKTLPKDSSPAWTKLVKSSLLPVNPSRSFSLMFFCWPETVEQNCPAPCELHCPCSSCCIMFQWLPCRHWHCSEKMLDDGPPNPFPPESFQSVGMKYSWVPLGAQWRCHSLAVMPGFGVTLTDTHNLARTGY